MGCSVCKELVESPSEDAKETWEVVLPKGLALHLDTSFKTMEASYLAAVFSTNYTTIRRRSRALDRNKLLLSHELPCIDYPQKKANKSARVDSWDVKEALLDPTLVEPMLRWGEKKQASTGSKSVEGAKVELETINTWELMKDLDEQEDSLTNKPSHDKSPPTDDSIPKSAATMPRSKCLTSFKCAEDVDASIAASKTRVLASEESFCIALQDVKEVKECGGSGSHKLSARQGDILPEDGSLLVCRHTCETTSNRELWCEPRLVSSWHEESAWKPHNRQRALSMKYILSDNAREKEYDFLDVNCATSKLSEVYSREPDEGDLAYPMATLSCASECSSSLSSPEFSATASLKDWLPSDTTPFMLTDALQGGFNASIFEGIQATHNLLEQQMSAYLLPNTRRVLSKYVGGGADFSVEEKGLQSNVEASMVSFKVENFAIRALDTELGDSFHKAKEERCRLWAESLGNSHHSLHNPVDFGSKALPNYVHNPDTTTELTLDHVSTCKSEDKSSINGSTRPFTRKNAETNPRDPNSYVGTDNMKCGHVFQEKKVLISLKNTTDLTMKPRGEDDDVVFYSTTSQSDAKLYEDCNRVRGLLESLVGVFFDERDIARHPEYVQELKHALDISAASVPTVYAKGKYVVGGDSILRLYNKGILGSILKDALIDDSTAKLRCICAGGTFLICPFCKGRRKLNRLGEGASLCRNCSGTGLIKCTGCTSS